MGIYFGTDGIRGKYGVEITPSLAYKCGLSIAKLCKNKKVLIGKDTRTSGDVIALSLANGLLSQGVDVYYVGISPTPVISYLTSCLGFDYGVVISASHNPPQDNGIKIFDKNGYKITEKEEDQIEKFFSFSEPSSFSLLGKFVYCEKLLKLYENYINNKIGQNNNLKIIVDCANGATSILAKRIFRKFSKNVTFMNTKKDGLFINHNCGALHPEKLVKQVLKLKANVGFAFDGDGDRIIVVNEKGEILDGDDILYILSKHSQSDKMIAGTIMTNKGLENALMKNGIRLIRTDVGDKYVASLMKENSITLGGETSGHIIISDISKTGDSIACALLLCKILTKTNLALSKMTDYEKYPQINISIPVQDKFRIMNSEILRQKILDIQNLFSSNGRVLVRPSGTENKIRVMCEHLDKNTAKECAHELSNIITLLT